MPRFTRKKNDEHPLFSDAFSVNERIGIEIKLQEMLKRVSFMVNKQCVANDQGFRLKWDHFLSHWVPETRNFRVT